MGAGDLTTDVPGAEVVDDGKPSPANGTHAHVAKKRKKQNALAAVVANGHVGKVAKRKPSQAAEEPDASESNGDGEAEGTNGTVAIDGRTLELPAVEDRDKVDEVSEVDDATAVFEDEEAAGIAEVDGVDGVEPKLRKRAAKRSMGLVAEPPPDTRAEEAAEPKLRRRAAKRAAAARRETPAGRRAELVATAASFAAAAAEPEASSSPGRGARIAKAVRRLVALIAILMVPGAVYALATTKGPVSTLPHDDAAYLSEQLITADQRVRKQLVRLRPLHTSPAIARTRESQLTARSIRLELGNHGGSAADRLQRAVRLEAVWLDAVGSVLANPRSPLRDQLVARDRALRPALAALPSTEGLRRKGGAENLRDFARSRAAAKRKSRR